MRDKRIDGNTEHTPPVIAGDCFGIGFGDGGSNGLFQIFVEDDEAWHTTSLTADVFWLHDLRNVLDRAIREVESRNE